MTILHSSLKTYDMNAFSKTWSEEAKNRDRWKRGDEAFAQQWDKNGSKKVPPIKNVCFNRKKMFSYHIDVVLWLTAVRNEL